MAGKMLVGDMVAEFLQQCGVTTAFGIVSVHNIPMLDAIGRRNAIRFVMARGEMGGAHMADAYARVSGKLGVLVTSTGPGAANAVGGIVEARFAGSPMLHLTGQTATGNIDRGQGPVHDVPDQLGMLRSISKAAYRVRSPETALGTLIKAATEALTPQTGPVSVEIPIDIQRAEIDRPEELEVLELPLPPPTPPAPKLLDGLVRMAEGAKRPVLWIGNGGKYAGAAVERLARLGFGIVTSFNGRGVVSEDNPMCIGALGTMPDAERFFEETDLLIVAGCRLRGHETRDISFRMPRKIAQIDVDPLADGRTYASDWFVCADAELTLAALADRLEGRWKPADGYIDEVKTLKREMTERYRDSLGPYASFPEQLRAALPRDGVWVRDITLNNSTWGNRIFPLHGPRDSVYPVGAAIGPGMQLGIGAAMAAEGRKVIAMCGDGGFFLNVGELWTAVQERLDLCILVMNDKGYGVIKHIQDALYGGRHFYGDLKSPDLQGLAQLAGIPFWRATKANQLGESVRRALNTGGPTLVQVE